MKAINAQGVDDKEEIASTTDISVDTVDDHRLYLNRELSLLEFNRRVLEQSLDETYPLLERLKFLLIFSSNLDEFFEIRVSGLKKQVAFSRERVSDDGLLPHQVLDRISEIVHELVKKQYRILNEVLLPKLASKGICFFRRRAWNAAIKEWARSYFENEIIPIITPIGLDPTHPFPLLVNKSFNFIVELEGIDVFGRSSGLAIIPAPRSLPRVVPIPRDVISGDGDNFVFLSSLIHAHASDLFPGMLVKSCYQFRLTRNADLSVDTENVSDLARALRGELFSRRYGDAVRLEVADNCPEHLSSYLCTQFGLSASELYTVDGPVNLTRLFSITDSAKHPDLKYKSFSPVIPSVLAKSKDDIFSVLKKSDILLSHPYESFTPVIDFVRQAAKDANVLAIKQTLYRTESNSAIVDALIDAARNGKEVTAVIEIRARFDEEGNLKLASRLQEAGVIVTYGVVGFKTHAKICLVLRREGGILRRYAHLGTGNYHTNNAKLYTDYSFLTADIALCEDLRKLFGQLIGMRGQLQTMDKLLYAPFTLRKSLVDMINNEIAIAAKGQPARIIMKVNGLTDRKIINVLYKASQAGVKVDLLVRGKCCLCPGIPGVSHNIRVCSVVGRFLEHSRVFYFYNEGKEKIYLSSADLMERNLNMRVEIGFPIESRRLVVRIRKELELFLADNSSNWILQSDGSYVRAVPKPHQKIKNVQQMLLDQFLRSVGK